MKTAIVLCLMMGLAGCKQRTNGTYVREHKCSFVGHIAGESPSTQIVNGEEVVTNGMSEFSVYQCDSPDVKVFVDDDDPNAPPVPQPPQPVVIIQQADPGSSCSNIISTPGSYITCGGTK